MTEDFSPLAAEHYNATVVSIRRPHDELMVLRVRPDKGPLPFEPGQYATLGLGFWEARVEGSQEESERQKEKKQKLARRAESFSHPILSEGGERLLSPGEPDFHEFFMNLVKRSPAGVKPPEFTPRLYHSSIRPGSRTFIDEKVKGAYTLGLENLTQGKHLVFASNGTGEAPHNAMIWKLLHMGYDGRITSIVSVMRKEDLAYLEVHEQLERVYGNYHYIWLATEESAFAQRNLTIQEFVLSGRLEERIGERLDPERMSFFLCGSDSLIGVPSIDRGTRRKIYPKDPSRGQSGLIEVLETKYGFAMDPLAKSSGQRGNIHFEKWY
ncbi:MAG: ferredoxin--NADP reductase [Nitrospinota bacterium]